MSKYIRIAIFIDILFLYIGCLGEASGAFIPYVFAFDVPFFFFLMIDIYHNDSVEIWRWVVAVFMVVAAILCGNMIFRLNYLGCALTLMLMVLVFFGRRMNRRLRRTLLCLTLALNIFWTAYLFNCFLSDGWVFT